jgi:hypothetical protein
MSLNSLDYWRLADELPVIDAAILITGNDPSDRFEIYDDSGQAVRDANGVWRTAQQRDYKGFEAAFKSLKIAIRSNRLRANTRHAVNRAEYENVADYGYVPLDQGPGFTRTSYDFMVARKPRDTGQTVLNFSVDELRGCDDFYVWKEPDWEQTTIEVQDLKDWLANRGVFPPFFFPTGNQEGFRSKKNPRYAPKLAACIAAWEAVSVAAKNSSVKQTLKDWIRSNASAYGVGDESGIVSDTAAEELAKIVNWSPGGGATPTTTSSEAAPPRPREPIQNFPYGYPVRENLDADDTDPLPF